MVAYSHLRRRSGRAAHVPQMPSGVRSNGSKSNGEGEVGAGLEVVAAPREELLSGDALLVAHSPRA